MTPFRFLIALALVALGFVVCCCGGAGGPPSSSGPTVGGGGIDGPTPLTPGSFDPPIVAPAADSSTLPGAWFGVSNQTTSDIVAYAWWETRDNVPPGMPGMRWYNLAPLGSGIAPGTTHLLTVGENGRPWYEPAVGLLAVRAYLRDGTIIDATILYVPTTSSVWVVRR